MKTDIRNLLARLEATTPKVETTYRTTKRDPCDGKVSHPTIAAAQAVCDRLLNTKGQHTTAYVCSKCGRIHTGHTFDDHRLDGHPMPTK
jgi:hypothetical protein